jgi:hypothetical protein
MYHRQSIHHIYHRPNIGCAHSRGQPCITAHRRPGRRRRHYKHGSYKHEQCYFTIRKYEHGLYEHCLYRPRLYVYIYDADACAEDMHPWMYIPQTYTHVLHESWAQGNGKTPATPTVIYRRRQQRHCRIHKKRRQSNIYMYAYMMYIM